MGTEQGKNVRNPSFPVLVEGVFKIEFSDQVMATRDSMTIPKSKKSITLEKEIETKVRKIQARLIEKTDQSWSISMVLNILVTGGLTHTKKMSKSEWQKVKTMVEQKEVSFDDSMITDFVKKIGE
ncbi:MAG: hypothetical protein HZA84_04845 [Thaumarchaeota archaeon]|nr:hypothetical protein [Nitrososphaerota archaeon]